MRKKTNTTKIVALTVIAVMLVFTAVVPSVEAEVSENSFVSGFSGLTGYYGITEPDLIPSGKGIAGDPRLVYTMEQFAEAMGEGSYSHIMLSDAGVTKGEDAFIEHTLSGEYIGISSSPGEKFLYVQGRHRITSEVEYVLPFITVSGCDLTVEGDADSAILYDCKASPSSVHSMFSIPSGNTLNINGEIALAVYGYDYDSSECAYESTVVYLGEGNLNVSGNPVLYGFCSTDSEDVNSSAVTVGPTGGEFADAEISMEISGGRFISVVRGNDGSFRHDDSGYGIYTGNKAEELMDILITCGVFSGGVGNEDGTSSAGDYTEMGFRTFGYSDGMCVVTENPFDYMAGSGGSELAPEFSAYDNVPFDAEFTFCSGLDITDSMGFFRTVSVQVSDSEGNCIESESFSAKEQEGTVEFTVNSHDAAKYRTGGTYKLSLIMQLYDPYGTFVDAYTREYTLGIAEGVRLSDIDFADVSMPVAGNAAQPPSFNVTANTDNYIISECYWTDGDNNVFTGVFGEGELYSACVRILPLPGEKIVPYEYLSVTVDGEYPVLYNLSEQQDELTVTLCGYYAQTQPRTDMVQAVHITGLQEPVKGGAASETVSFGFEPAEEGFGVENVYWTTSDNSVFTGIFESGTEYKLYIVLRADDGSYFAPASSMDITVNGEMPDYINISSDEYGKNTLCYIMMRYVVDLPTYISYVDITGVSGPVAGESASAAPEYTIVSDMSAYEVVMSFWGDSDNNPYSGEFAEGGTYYANISLRAKDGAEFVDVMHISVDGSAPVSYTLSSGEGVCNIIMKKFVARRNVCRVYGNITSSGDETAPVSVVLRNISADAVMGSCTVYGNNAAYEFTDIEPGEYVLAVSKDGFMRYSGNISLSGSDTEINVQLAINGDITGDGIVNSSDLSELLGKYGTTDAGSDIDGNGVVNSSDLAILLENYGKTA